MQIIKKKKEDASQTGLIERGPTHLLQSRRNARLPPQ